MGQSLADWAQRVAIAIRTGSNGTMQASVKSESYARQLVYVLRALNERDRVSVGRVILLVGSSPNEPLIDLSELDRDYAQEVTELVVRGKDIPFAELRGRDEALTILRSFNIQIPTLTTAHLADACLCADVALGSLDSEEARGQFVRGVLHQAEAMQPGMREYVVQKLKSDAALVHASGLAWLARAIGVAQSSSSQAGRPKKTHSVGEPKTLKMQHRVKSKKGSV